MMDDMAVVLRQVFRPTMTGVLGGLLALVSAASGAAEFAPDPERYPLRGIDVSHHQGAIDWRRVGAAGIAFAYIKATEGRDHLDERFEENWRGAARAGIARGAYHFYSVCRPGRPQADNFIARVPVSRRALPPAVDLEFTRSCRRRPSGPALRRELRTFLAMVERHHGRTPVLYVTRPFHDAYLTGRFGAHPFWVRSIGAEPEFRIDRWTIWQWTSRGRIPGIKGPVDINVFHGNRSAFDRWRRPPPLPAGSPTTPAD